jgi:hypothetical protein
MRSEIMPAKLRVKMDKKFLEINMPKWLYDECIKYSEKHHVSHAIMGRAALYHLVFGSMPLSPEDDKRFTERFYFEPE